MVWKMFLLWRYPFLSPYFYEKSPAKPGQEQAGLKPSDSRRKTGLRVGRVYSFETKHERTKIIEEYEL